MRKPAAVADSQNSVTKGEISATAAGAAKAKWCIVSRPQPSLFFTMITLVMRAGSDVNNKLKLPEIRLLTPEVDFSGQFPQGQVRFVAQFVKPLAQRNFDHVSA